MMPTVRMKPPSVNSTFREQPVPDLHVRARGVTALRPVDDLCVVQRASHGDAWISLV
jgi:hypothetical protein